MLIPIEVVQYNPDDPFPFHCEDGGRYPNAVPLTLEGVKNYLVKEDK